MTTRNSSYQSFRNAVLATVTLLLVVTAQQGIGQSFNFETAPVSTVTSLSQTSGGLTMTITRQNSANFSVTDLSGFAGTPPSWGARSLDPFFANGAGATTNGFIANFSSAITFFSMQFGDYAFPDVDTLTLTAWSGVNGAGSMIAQVVVAQTGAFPTFNTATVAGLGIQSVTWSSTTPDPFPNTLFYDNFVTQGAQPTVPETGATALLLGLATLMLAGLRVRITRRC